MAIKIYQSKYTGKQIDAQLDKVDTKAYTLEDPQGSSWVRIAKLTDPELISKGLVSLKPSGIRVDTYYNPIKDFNPETVLSAGTSYRFKVDYDYTDHIDTISDQGLNLNITAGGSEVKITDNHTPRNLWQEIKEESNFETVLGQLITAQTHIVYYNIFGGNYLDGNATLVFTNTSDYPLEVFVNKANHWGEIVNDLENYDKVLVQPQETVNFDLEDQNINLDLYIYNPNSEAINASYTHKIVGGRGRATTNYITITPETDIQVKDILVQASVENFDYFLTSLEQIRVEEVPVNFPYVQFKAVYDPLTNRADVNPILVSSGNAGITDISWGGTSSDSVSSDSVSSDSGSDMSSYSEASEVSENEVDLTETGEEETTEENTNEETTNETTDPISSDEPVLTSDSDYSSGDGYMDSGSGSGSGVNIYDFGFKAATFECYDGQVYLDVLLHHPATNNYKDFNLTSTLEEAENLELLEEIVPHDLEAVLDRQLLEGSTFEKGVNYEFVISGNYQDYIDAISQNKEINITYTPTTVEGEDLDPVTILKYNSEELIILDSDTSYYEDENYFMWGEYPDHIISSIGYNQLSSLHYLQSEFARKSGYVFYTKLAGTAVINFDTPYKDVTVEDIQSYINLICLDRDITDMKLTKYEVLESSEDRSSITFSFKLEGLFESYFDLDWLVYPMQDSEYSFNRDTSTLTIDPAETEFCLKLPFTPEQTVIFDRYSIDNNDAYNFQLRVNNLIKSQTCEQFDLYSPQAAIRTLDRTVSQLNNRIDNVKYDISSLSNKINDQNQISFDKTFYTGITKTKIEFTDYLSFYNRDKFIALYDFITSKQGLVRACCVDEDENIVAYDLVTEFTGNRYIKFNKYDASYDFYWYVTPIVVGEDIFINGTCPDKCYLIYEGTDPELLDFFDIKIPLHYNSPITKDLQENKQDKILSTPNITIDTSASFVIPNVDTLFTEENYHEAPILFTFNSNLYFMQLNDVDSSSCLTFSSNKAFSLTPTENLIYDGNLEYFAAEVSDWTPVQVGTPIKSLNNKIYLRGSGNTYCRHSNTPETYDYDYNYDYIKTTCFNLSGTNVSCDGNIETLLDWEAAKAGNHPTMGDWCFRGLFNRCSSLIKAPDLPATTLSHGCYSTMFSHCSLTEAPELPALKMVDICYAGIFAYNPINTAPIIASTELAPACYSSMFYQCSSLTEAPELPAMKVPNNAYVRMFCWCSNLIKAPELPATDLGSKCYGNMFYGCSGLTEAPNILPAMKVPYRAYFGMFNGCSSLTKTPELPATDLGGDCYMNMFEFCSSITKAPDLPAVKVPDYAYFGMFYGCSSLTEAPELPATDLGDSCYSNMFYGCSSLTKAPELPAMKVPDGAYVRMLSNCTSITEAPELPATDIGEHCYSNMFNGCSSLTKAPELPAMKVPDSAYVRMFNGCSSLTEAPELPATDLGGDCYSYMFNGCSSLTKAPTILPATNAPGYAYNYMFYGCSSLTEAPEILATTLGSATCEHMFSGTQITTPPVLLADYIPYKSYWNMFQDCKLVHFPAIKATTFGINPIGDLGIRDIKLSTTPTEECPYEFRIPWGTATATVIHDAGHLRPDISYENPGDGFYPLTYMHVTDTSTGTMIDAALNTTYYANIPTVE